jgi:uncharacterized delta-60 repeat protein
MEETRMSWKTLFAGWNGGGSRRRTPRPRQVRPQLELEALEDRTLLNARFFGAQGKVITPFSGAQVDLASSVLVQPNGKIVAVGISGNTVVNLAPPGNFFGNSFALARYTTGGALDPTFGNGGRVTTSFPGKCASVMSAALQADGKVLVAGITFTSAPFNQPLGGQASVLARYTTAGRLDPTFGSGGKVAVLQGTNGFYGAQFYYVAALPNGEIAVPGS